MLFLHTFVTNVTIKICIFHVNSSSGETSSRQYLYGLTLVQSVNNSTFQVGGTFYTFYLHEFLAFIFFQQQNTQPDKLNRQLFTDIQRRGPRAFGELVQVLVDSNNVEAAKILDSTADAKSNGTLNANSKERWNSSVVYFMEKVWRKSRCSQN